MIRKFTSILVITSFLSALVSPIPRAQAQGLLGLPEPGTMVSLSPAYEPAIIKGVVVHKNNPFVFDFIVDTGQDHLSGERLKNESSKLIKYFLAGLTIPEKDLWVNLSPYEKDRTIPAVLAQTDMGRDLLAQDYLLKQITASLIYPDRQLGKTFWDKVYAQAQQMYGTTQVPVNTFNKVWITADRAEVYEHDNTAFVVDCHLKVMLEEDYLALQKHLSKGPMASTSGPHSLASQIVREIILPELEKEVNKGKNFFQVRQVFNSIILASWYKNRLTEALLNQVYSNKGKVKGIDLLDKTIKEKIYRRYLQAYKKGVFNFIREDTDPVQGGTIPRKYFSGGMDPGMAIHPEITENTTKYDAAMSDAAGDLKKVTAELEQEKKVAPLGFDYRGGIPNDERVHYLGVIFRKTKTVNGEPGVRVSEIWNPLLSANKLKYAVEQIKKNPGIRAVFLKASVIKTAANNKITLTPDMGIIPKDFVGKTVTLGENSSEILVGARSDSPQELEQVQHIAVRAGGYFRIKIHDNTSGEDLYLLTFNYERLQQNVPDYKLTPPGGGSRFYGIKDNVGNIMFNGKKFYQDAGLGDMPQVKFSPLDVDDPLAIRVEIAGKDCLNRFFEKFHSGQGRERFFPIREFYEELVGPDSEVGVLPPYPGFYQGEFYGTMTPEALIEAIRTRSEINFPANVPAIDLLYKLLKDQNLYKAQGLEIRPKEAQDFISRLEKGEQLNTFEIQKNNRLLIEANYPEAPKRRGYFAFNGWPYRDLGNIGAGESEATELRVDLPGTDDENAAMAADRGTVDIRHLSEVLLKAKKPMSDRSKIIHHALVAWRPSSYHNGNATALPKGPNGGIDLNTQNMKWDITKDGNGVEMTVDPAIIERIRHIGIDSLTPVIFRITPVESIWPLIGLQDPHVNSTPA